MEHTKTITNLKNQLAYYPLHDILDFIIEDDGRRNENIKN